MKVVLELQDQPANVRRVMVRHDIVIGRGSDCNLRLSAPQVSRRHCFLRVGRDAVTVTDLDSSNGTFVDGSRIKPGKQHDLSSGATLSLGPIRFVVHFREEAVSVDVLNSAGVHENRVGESGKRTTGRSTTVSDSSAAGMDARDAASRPMDFSVEQAGPAADENEPTASLSKKDENSSAATRVTGNADPGILDSRAEIVDLGRRISEFHETDAGHVTADIESDEAQQPPWCFGETDIKGEAYFTGLLNEDGPRPEDLPFMGTEEPNQEEATVDISAEAFSEDEKSDEFKPFQQTFQVAEQNSQGAIDEYDGIEEAAEVVEVEAVEEAAEVEELEDVVDVMDDVGELDWLAGTDETICSEPVLADSDVISEDSAEVLDAFEEFSEEPELEPLLLTEGDEDYADGYVEAEAQSSPGAEVIEEPLDDSESGKAGWFDGGSEKDDDIDPNLRDFLKGF